MSYKSFNLIFTPHARFGCTIKSLKVFLRSRRKAREKRYKLLMNDFFGKKLLPYKI